MPSTFAALRWIRSAALVCTLALAGAILPGIPARAQGVPVVDTQNIAQNIEQLRQMIEDEILQNEQLVQLREQLTTLTDQLAELQRTYEALTRLAELPEIIQTRMEEELNGLLDQEFGDILATIEAIKSGDFSGLTGSGASKIETQMDRVLADLGFDGDTLPVLAVAKSIPRSGPNDQRVRIAIYQEGQVFRLNVSLTHVTTVEFGEGESIRSIIAGDTVGFEIDGVPGGRAFAIKPLARSVHTNVTVYTNRRSYYFDAQEVSTPTFYVVQFRYPGDNRRPANAVARAAPNYSYGASARTEFTPTRVWDDGTFTYFALPRNAPVPAIFRYAGALTEKFCDP